MNTPSPHSNRWLYSAYPDQQRYRGALLAGWSTIAAVLTGVIAVMGAPTWLVPIGVTIAVALGMEAGHARGTAAGYQQAIDDAVHGPGRLRERTTGDAHPDRSA